MTMAPRCGSLDTAPHDRWSNRIQLLETKLERLDVRIGELMSQRVEAEEALAALYEQRNLSAKENGTP
jgi:hypothetical protein